MATATNNPNILFNGLSMKAAITQKLSEDHGLTSALFANSNISILIDILSYMYQTLMANLFRYISF
jgi:hypothetical protein